MALKFWLGGADSDKSQKLTEYILDEAKSHPERQYLYVVPEQFGLSTQRALVLRSENCGILNIDVLSFTRLAHRIIDEVGSYSSSFTTLDDMGKSLLIGMIANRHRKDLPSFGDKLDRPGFIDRIRSLISEYMQYGISVEKAFELSEDARRAGRGLLAQKLGDTAFIYSSFREYIRDRYTTVEETLDIVSTLVPSSDTVKNSVVIFDGFTGFTPLQNKLIGVLMEYAVDVHVALLLEDCIQENEKKLRIEEHELFYLSRKTVRQLERMADERHIVINDPYKSVKTTLSNARYLTDSSVYTDDNIKEKFNNTDARIRLFVAANPYDEIRMVIRRIRELIRKKGYHYKDIAVLTGDIEGYRHPVERLFKSHDIPYFIDRTEPVLLNPFIEYIRSFIDILSDNYDVSAVFRYLKSSLAGFEDEEVNMLENYCLAANIKGYSKWHTRFDVCTDAAGADELLILNDIRERFIGKTDMFAAHLADAVDTDTGRAAAGAGEGVNKSGNARINAASRFTVREFSRALYALICSEGIEEKLKKASEDFENAGNRRLAAEYGRIYVQIMDILDELCELIPDEKTDIRGFGTLLDAGLSAIRIGVIPAGLDHVQIGDLTRSRFDDIRALFIIGANDGIIPKIPADTGIINERERDFLKSINDSVILAPAAREEIYTQQLYIYMALSRPSDVLFVSYPNADTSGKALLPSYLTGRIRNLYPDITVETDMRLPEHYEDETEAFDELMRAINPAVSGTLTPDMAERVRGLVRYFLGREKYRDRLLAVMERETIRTKESAKDSIGAALARAIYGDHLSASITRLEAYAACAYGYFLEYGLKLKEREIFAVDGRDIGLIFHDTMKVYSELMKESGCEWSDAEADERRRLMDKAVDRVMDFYMPRKLSSSARYAYMSGRIRKVMHKSADIISAQVGRGHFKPSYFEVDFDELQDIGSLNIRLSDDEIMRLRGRIDRIDTCETDDGIYIRVIDYKSSSRDIDLMAVYEGRQLQLLMYLNVAMEGLRHKLKAEGSSKEVIPAGVLYYHIDDPMIAADGDISDDEVQRQIMKKLRLQGLVNSDTRILHLHDEDIEEESLVVPVSVKKNGEVRASRHSVSGEDLELLAEYVTGRIRETGREIMSGNIAVPEPDGRTRFSGADCSFCPYTGICGNKGRAESEASDGGADWIGLIRRAADGEGEV